MSETSVVNSAVFITWRASTSVQIFSVGLLPSFPCSVRSFTRPDPLLKSKLLKSWIQLHFALKTKKNSLILLLDRTCQEIKVPDIHIAVQKSPQVWGFLAFSYSRVIPWLWMPTVTNSATLSPNPSQLHPGCSSSQQPWPLSGTHTGQNKAQKFILLDLLPGS